MTVQLGSAFNPPIEDDAPEDDLLALRLELVLSALDNLAGSLRDMPAPQIMIDAPDLGAIVTAVNGLKPGVDADQIAAAVVAAIAPAQPVVADEGWKDELLAALKKLDFRMKGNVSGGHGLVSDISDRPTRLLGVVSSVSQANGSVTGTLTAVNQAVTLTVPDGHSSWTVTLAGTFSATSQVAFEFSEDGTNWFAANGRRNLDINTNDTTNLLDANPNGGPAPLGSNPSHWRGNAGGIKYLRVRCAIFTNGDAVAVQINSSTGVGTTFLNSPTPPVANYAATGTLNLLNDAVTIAALGMSGWSAVITGTWTGTVSFEASVDGVTWNPINGAVQGVGTLVSSVTANTQVRGSVGGLKNLRVRLSTLGTGSASVALTAGAGTAGTFMTAPVPPPAGVFGYVSGASGTPVFPAGAKMQTLTVHCTTAGSVTINGGSAIPIPANSSFSDTFPDGKLIAPTIVCTGSDSYYASYLL